MPLDKQHLDELARLIREHRSNESNFETLYQTLQAEAATDEQHYGSSLQEAEKAAAEYKQIKETGSSAWPEFEKFVAQFEKSVLEAKKEA